MLLLKWLCAHLIGDFILQTNKMVRHKKRLKYRSWVLYFHSILHGVLIYLFTAQWLSFAVPLLVIVSHTLIDIWKLNKPDNIKSFLIDQLLHITALVVLYFIYQAGYNHTREILVHFWNHKQAWAIMTGYIIIIWPAGILIGLLTQRWRNDIELQFEKNRQSLADAGKWIGIFERILVYTFIITNQFAGIGFLITAKSILRFNETKKESGRKEAEYILIGTFISFACSIIIGLLINYIIS